MDPHIQLHAVIFKSGEWWVGQCLEYDIAAQAKTPKDLSYEIQRAVVGQIAVASENQLDPFAMLGRAPKRYWDMFDSGLKVETGNFIVDGCPNPGATPEVQVRVSEPMPA